MISYFGSLNLACTRTTRVGSIHQVLILRKISSSRNSMRGESSTEQRVVVQSSDEETPMPVKFQVMNKIGVITLDRPKSLNVINVESVKLVRAQLLDWAKEESGVQAVLIEGSGNKAFCAGGDVVTVINSDKLSTQLDFFRTEYLCNNLIKNYPLPYISLWDGIVMGGGLGLSVHGSYRVATEKTLIAMPETAIGLIPDVGGGFFLPRLRYTGLGMYMALTGHRLKGSDVLHSGSATHICPSIRLSQLKDEVIDKVNSSSKSRSEQVASNHETISRILRHYTNDFPLPDSISLTPYVRRMIQHCFDKPHSVDEMFKTLKHCGGAWSEKTMMKLKMMSPTAVMLTQKHIQLGRDQDENLAQTLKREFRVVTRCLQKSYGSPDFYTGVTAVLVNKMRGDERPDWSPSTLQDIDEQVIKGYFEPFKSGVDVIIDENTGQKRDIEELKFD